MRVTPTSHGSHSHSSCDSHSHAEPQSEPLASSSAHSHCCNSGASVAINQSNPVAVFLSKLAAYRSSTWVAIASAVLFAVAGFLHLMSFTPFHLVPLGGVLCLAGVPAIADASLAIVSDSRAALSIDVLMTLAAVASVITGALFEASLLMTLFAVSLSAEESVSKRAARHIDSLLRRASPKTALRLETSKSGEPTSVALNTVVPGDLILVPVGEAAPCDGVVVDNPAMLSVAQITGESVPITVSVGNGVNAGSVPQDSPLVLRVTCEAGQSFLSRMARLVDDGLKIRPAVKRFFDEFGSVYTRTVLIVAAAVALLLPLVSLWVGPLMGFTSGAIGFTGKAGSITRALGLLVVMSPCALLIGAPIAYTAALSCCARKGVLVKGGSKALGSAASTSHIVFDKTGTLTTGQLDLVSTHKIFSPESTSVAHNGSVGLNRSTSSVMTSSASDYLDSLQTESLLKDRRSQAVQNGKKELHLQQHLQQLDGAELRSVVCAAAALERGAVHPIADAIRTKARDLGGVLPEVADARVVSGQGVEGDLHFTGADRRIAHGRLGRPSFILDSPGYGALLRELNEDAAQRGETVSILAVDEELYVLRMRDEVRSEAAEVVNSLVEGGNKVSILTGDANGAANFVCDAMTTTVINKVNLSNGNGNGNGNGNDNGSSNCNNKKSSGDSIAVVSDATPDEKMQYVAKLGTGVMMIGDGINDSAALAAAPVGIAFGLSSPTTVDAAQVVLIRQNLHDIAWFLRKARATEAIVKQNVIVGLGLMVGAAAACVSGTVPLWLAVLLHEGGSILVGMNGLRLLRDDN